MSVCIVGDSVDRSSSLNNASELIVDLNALKQRSCLEILQDGMLLLKLLVNFCGIKWIKIILGMTARQMSVHCDAMLVTSLLVSIGTFVCALPGSHKLE